MVIDAGTLDDSKGSDFPRIQDYVGDIVALRKTGTGTHRSEEYGEREYTKADTVVFTHDEEGNLTHEHLENELHIYPVVLQRLVQRGDGDWVVGKLIRPKRAYLLDSPPDSILKYAENALSSSNGDDGEVPESF